VRRLVIVEYDDGSIALTEKEGFTNGAQIILLLETAKLDFHYDMMKYEEAQVKSKKE
jgi:hypothetical protein